MTTQRVRVRIHPDQILRNYNHIQSLVPQNTKVLAVVKADAYGHGASFVCKMLHEKAGCDYFAVACIEEAIALREEGVSGNILILGNTDPSYAPTLEKLDLIQSVDNVAYASSLSGAGKVRIHIKVDTGMSRLGFYCHSKADAHDAAKQIESISKMQHIQIDGIFTHFADSDGASETFTRRQYESFVALLEELKCLRVEVGIRHCCNSAAIIRFPEMHLDMVRAGIILYGLMPSEYIRDDTIAPAMELIARVSAVNTIKKGDTVSYGGTFTAPKDMRIGVLSIGYADGLPRALSGNLTVQINGRTAKLIGRICMDLCMVDLEDIECCPGDEAIIFDSAEKIDEIAAKLNTINYEVICLLKKRVALEYV